MLKIQNLHSDLFGPISLDVDAGECIAIRGPSGAGKSLFLRALADLDPVRGQVWLNGVSRERMAGWQWRSRVALVPAQTGWWADRVADHFTVDARRGLDDLLTELGLPAQALTWTVDRLSSGETQRLAIARALLQQPQVLLLDEPTASLDGDATRRVEALISRLAGEGIALIVVTHDPAQAMRISQRRYRIEAGRLHDEVVGRTEHQSAAQHYE